MPRNGEPSARGETASGTDSPSLNGRRKTRFWERESRTPQERSDARERILNAAEHLFASRGFDGTPTKEIAWEAGVPSGLVFYYFPTKRALLLAIIDERSFLPELKALVQAEMESHGDPRAELTAVGVHILDYVNSRAAVARILAGEVLAHPEVLEHLREQYEEAILLIAAYLDEEIRQGKLHPINSGVAARLFAAGIVMAAFDRPADAREYVSTTVDTLLRGIVIEE